MARQAAAGAQSGEVSKQKSSDLAALHGELRQALQTEAELREVSLNITLQTE